MPASADRYLEVQRSEEFAQLRHKLRSFIFPTTIAFIVWYALYVLLSAYARDFMSIKLIGNINIALVFGILQFVSTFGIAWFYARYAAKELDPRADAVYNELENNPEAAATTPEGSAS
ncbi:uncharacterized membrane protein (DUF485 family) [Actinoplanes lutulentus]|uniref:Uncharacterized membrane protein (DUF485 family) n=1 Tax=Actinoplanes lutulentus TaxID=1287878 RepID=A0A327ZAT3_9ACTN|nr:DUF485 domain-containing protein [Actinoplanes lutulentus]MBB2944707.1 uncharacterized membrane protein (DUF485 family) [Actinoplanes lutulentus]RAK35498.1 uncharacterized membrane protein (DUF485 family) [Actinoplanes lutulentus]